MTCVPVDDLRKLVARLREQARAQVPAAYTERGLAQKYLASDTWAGGVSDAADELEALLERYDDSDPIPRAAGRATLRCTCGRSVDAAVWWNGLTWVVRPADWARGRLLDACPHCGEGYGSHWEVVS